MCANRGVRRVIAALVPMLCWTTIALGQEASDDGSAKANHAAKADQDFDAAVQAAGKSTSGEKKEDTAGEKKEGASKPKRKGDPAKAAFLLPKHVVLNTKQQQAFDRLKAENEEPLRSAADRLQEATGPREEQEAAKAMKELRAKIRAGIQEILAMPYTDAMAKAQRGKNPKSDQYTPGDDTASTPSDSPSPDGGYPRNYGPGYSYPGYPGYPPYYPYAPGNFPSRGYGPRNGPPPKTPPPPPRSNGKK